MYRGDSIESILTRDGSRLVWCEGLYCLILSISAMNIPGPFLSARRCRRIFVHLRHILSIRKFNGSSL